LKGVQAHSEGATPAELLYYLSWGFGMTVRPNHLDAALQPHRRAGQLENRDQRGTCLPKSMSITRGTEGSNPSPPVVSRANRRFLVIVTVASAGVANAVHHRHIIGASSLLRLW
jgi:hypothetical protein